MFNGVGWASFFQYFRCVMCQKWNKYYLDLSAPGSLSDHDWISQTPSFVALPFWEFSRKRRANLGLAVFDLRYPCEGINIQRYIHRTRGIDIQNRNRVGTNLFEGGGSCGCERSESEAGMIGG